MSRSTAPRTPTAKRTNRQPSLGRSEGRWARNPMIYRGEIFCRHPGCTSKEVTRYTQKSIVRKHYQKEHGMQYRQFSRALRTFNKQPHIDRLQWIAICVQRGQEQAGTAPVPRKWFHRGAVSRTPAECLFGTQSHFIHNFPSVKDLAKDTMREVMSIGMWGRKPCVMLWIQKLVFSSTLIKGDTRGQSTSRPKERFRDH
ncbi:hypothetical protein N7449_002233 [Penicillium cf. viridicatum]|uniref:Uncharacterized protein n=1 Tax=Penicillium cf. viridicatum TaxID=2972119 RepID=A0A9W9MUM8_9EURO|nr:hypothetical protein N7449_002233 [Penicillium cf. viridicatum]